MDVIQFYGTFSPGNMHINTEDYPTIAWKRPSQNIDVRIKIQFKARSVIIDCELISFDVDRQLTALLQVAQNYAQTMIDLAAFKLGYACTLIIHQVKRPSDDKWVTLAHGDRSLDGLASSVADEDAFKTVLIKLLDDPVAMLGLRDLIDSMRNPNTAEINFARAMETVRSQFAANGKRSEGWAEMREALCVSEPYLRSIVEASRGLRHGNRFDRSPELQQISIRAWTIMDRFLEMKKRGSQALPVSEFPVLELSQA